MCEVFAYRSFVSTKTKSVELREEFDAFVFGPIPVSRQIFEICRLFFLPEPIKRYGIPSFWAYQTGAGGSDRYAAPSIQERRWAR